jgi:hypothetical protein
MLNLTADFWTVSSNVTLSLLLSVVKYSSAAKPMQFESGGYGKIVFLYLLIMIWTLYKAE